MARRWVVFSGLLVLAVFVATIPLPRVDGHITGSDGLYYYSILRSAALDHDLDLANDYALMGAPSYAATPTGRPGAPFSVGTPLLWAPFFLLAHGLTLAAKAAGVVREANGVGTLDEACVCIGSILYAIAGLWLVFHTAARALDDEFAAACAALATWWATSLIEYTVAEPSMSHGASFFANALFLAIWLRPGARPATGRMLALGASAGLVALVRSQEALVLLVPACALAFDAFRGHVAPGRALAMAAVLCGAFGVVFLPQMAFWHSVYGSWITVPQGGDFMRWGAPRPDLILFSTRHGLIAWHPAILIALIGLVPLWRVNRGLALAVGGTFLAQLYVNSVVSQWWAGDAFGGRRFNGMLPWLALPMAAAAASVARARGRALVIGVLATLVLWNGLSLVQYRLGFVPRSEALTWRQMTVDRITLPGRLAGRLLRR